MACRTGAAAGLRTAEKQTRWTVSRHADLNEARSRPQHRSVRFSCMNSMNAGGWEWRMFNVRCHPPCPRCRPPPPDLFRAHLAGPPGRLSFNSNFASSGSGFRNLLAVINCDPNPIVQTKHGAGEPPVQSDHSRSSRTKRFVTLEPGGDGAASVA
jgi:hypothetical protein